MPPSARPMLVIGVLASCGLAVSLLQTLVVPLLPRFPQLLGTSSSTVAWLVTATLVAGAVSAPVLGRLGDMRGKRKMLVAALALVTVGSALGAAAPTVEVLIVARALQGASFGVIALGISVMRDVLPPGKVGGGVALMSSSLGIGGAIGLPVTGLVAQFASWRWLFAGAAVIALLQIVIVIKFVPESSQRSGGRFDLGGAIGLAIPLISVLLAVSKGAEWGWGSPAVITLICVAAVAFPLWGRYELRRETPLVDLRVSARPAVLWTNIASTLIGFSMFTGFLVTTQILQAPAATGYGFGLPLVTAGVVLLPIGVAMTIFSPVSARISKWKGARTTLVLGTIVLMLGNLGVSTLPSIIPLMILATTISAVGAALSYSALPLLIMRAVPSSETAAANSLNTLMRMLGTSTCSAVVSAIATSYTTVVDGHPVPTATAYSTIFLCAAGAAVAGGVVAALTPRARAQARPSAELTQTA